jgi:hypothetical protein
MFIHPEERRAESYISVWVDDLLCQGHGELLKWALDELAKSFKLKIEDSTNDI